MGHNATILAGEHTLTEGETVPCIWASQRRTAVDKQSHHAAGEPAYEVVWPLGKSASDPISLSPPVSDLSGKTVGELWDWAFKGDAMFPLIRQRLGQRYRGIRFLDYNVFGNIRGETEREAMATLPERLRTHGCDVVISGVGA